MAALLGRSLVARGALLWAIVCVPLATAGQPRELGQVDWGRDLGAALARSRESGRPVLALFQEIPGCQTCVSFGEGPLSHPLLVETIEEAFVPLAIYNNRPGRDREVLERFGEPAWNNPVVRFLDADARDLLPRRDGVWSSFAVARRMVEALEAGGRPVPRHLREALDELTPRHTETATFAMYCYWSGEACLGGIPGVEGSRTGSLGGHEVVELRFDPKQLRYSDLLAQALRRGCADRVFAHDAEQEREARLVFGARVERASGPLRPASARDQHYYLRRSPFARLELTGRQSLRVNAALGNGEDPTRWLSPRQRRELAAAER